MHDRWSNIKGPYLFPPEWTNTQFVDKIWEASYNIVEVIRDGFTCLEVLARLMKEWKFVFVVRKADKFLVTAYPDLKSYIWI